MDLSEDLLNTRLTLFLTYFKRSTPYLQEYRLKSLVKRPSVRRWTISFVYRPNVTVNRFFRTIILEYHYDIRLIVRGVKYQIPIYF